MSLESRAPTNGQAFPSPLLFMLLMVPFGVANGYLTITLGFQLTQHAKTMSTSDFSELVAISLVPHTWRWLWAPVVDTTWTRKRWYVFGALCRFVWNATISTRRGRDERMIGQVLQA